MMYENLRNQSLPRQDDLIFINGHNDTWRHFVVEQLIDAGSQISVRQNLGTVPHKTTDSFFESTADTRWRDWVNGRYRTNLCKEQSVRHKPATDGMAIGIDGKFGTPPLMGDIIMPAYFENRCVIFPESTWQNDEVAVTEKNTEMLLRWQHTVARGGQRCESPVRRNWFLYSMAFAAGRTAHVRRYR